LIGRIRIDLAPLRKLAGLFYRLGGQRLENGIVVVADQREGIAAPLTWGSSMGRRKFTSGRGPDRGSSGSMPTRAHGPEKSGIAVALWAPIAGE